MRSISLFAVLALFACSAATPPRSGATGTGGAGGSGGGTGASGSGGASGSTGSSVLDAGGELAVVTLGASAPGATIPDDFLGLSLEWSGTRGFSSSSPDARAVQLLANLGHGVLRIGGNSEDEACFSADGGIARMPDGGVLDGYCGIPITAQLARNLFATSAATGWPLILGLNLGIDDAGAALEVIHRAVLPALDAGALRGLELGNEPDLFPGHLVKVLGVPQTMRPTDGGWTLDGEERQFNAYVDALRGDALAAGLPIVGPAASGRFIPLLGAFARAITDAGADRLQGVTFHAYAANRCAPYPDGGRGPRPFPDGGSSATIANLLSPQVAQRWRSVVGTGVASAQDAGFVPRLAEANSIACGGQPGTSDTFASAVWATDFMLSIAQLGVAGVNFHGGGRGPYTPIEVGSAPDGGMWFGARPLYLAMLLVAQTAVGKQPIAAALASADGGAPLANVTAYALQGCARCPPTVVLINKDLDTSGTVRVHPPLGLGSATVLTLTAPALDSTSGVTLGGAAVTAEGLVVPAPQSTPLAPDSRGDFVVPLAVAQVQVLQLAP